MREEQEKCYGKSKEGDVISSSCNHGVSSRWFFSWAFQLCRNQSKSYEQRDGGWKAQISDSIRLEYPWFVRYCQAAELISHSMSCISEAKENEESLEDMEANKLWYL